MTENKDESPSIEKRRINPRTIILRSVIGLNFLRFLLAFVPGFEEGVGGGPGLADRIFNPFHSNGFRSDFIWLVFSTLGIFVATFVYSSKLKNDKSARLNVILCVAWIATFFIYMSRVLSLGLLDFG
jgi:hypothetical protein